VDQHVISEFLLRGFGRMVGQQRMLTAFDKLTEAMVSIDVREFLTEPDAHTPEVEADFNRIESAAAHAIYSLRKAMRQLPPGMYAVSDVRVTAGPAIEDVGVRGGVRLHLSRHQVEALPEAEQEALLRFVALMYQRSPGMEASILEFGRIYESAAQAAIARLMPSVSVDLPTEVGRYRERISYRALGIAEKLRQANWWLVRPEPPAAFILGDSPVVATLSLGYDDQWRAILSGDAYVVAMPLGPDLALLIAPQLLMPVNVEPTLGAVTAAVNRLLWRQADRYVVARDARDLEAAWQSGLDPIGRRETAAPPVDAAWVAASARAEALSIVTMVLFRAVERAGWRHWDGCRLTFGVMPYAAQDRAKAGFAPCPGWPSGAGVPASASDRDLWLRELGS
jgi:hypothetical protein